MKVSQFTVSIRRNLGKTVKPEAEELDGKTFFFRFGWLMDTDGPYPNEVAWIPWDDAYPIDGPVWLASGDLLKGGKSC